MMMTDHNDDMLDDIFAQARSVTPTPSADLMARVLADAANAMPDQNMKVAPTGRAKRILEMLGGWTGVSGLVTATCAGVWIGVAPPAVLQDYAASYYGDEVSVDFYDDVMIYATGDFTDGS